MKILYVLNSLNIVNGVSSVIMRYYKNFNHDGIHCDFIVHINQSPNCYTKLIHENSDNIYQFPKINIRNISKIKKEVKNFLNNHNDYDVIHCNLPHISYYYLKYAYEVGIGKRILHIHNPILSENVLSSIRNRVMIDLSYKYATDLFACSYDSGYHIYKKRSFYVQKNAFDYNEFCYDANQSQKIRKMYNLTDYKVVGCVGRFTKQKNFIFSLKCIKKFIKLYDDKICLFLVGNGKEKQKYLRFIKKNKLENNVIFVEPTQNINDYYSAFDILLMPSLFEGIGIVSLEAQVNGCFVIHSQNVPQETNIGRAVYVNLKQCNEWCETIKNNGRSTKQLLDDFRIEKNVELLFKEYERGEIC